MALLEAIAARHSVRKYLDKEIPADILAALQDKIEECNKVGNLNIQLVLNEAKALTGMLSYGKFCGVKNTDCGQSAEVLIRIHWNERQQAHRDRISLLRR